MTRWTARGGWEVELIRLDGHDRYRLTQHGVLADYYATLADLERALAKQGLSVADLEEAPAPKR